MPLSPTRALLSGGTCAAFEMWFLVLFRTCVHPCFCCRLQCFHPVSCGCAWASARSSMPAHSPTPSSSARRSGSTGCRRYSPSALAKVWGAHWHPVSMSRFSRFELTSDNGSTATASLRVWCVLEFREALQGGQSVEPHQLVSPLPDTATFGVQLALDLDGSDRDCAAPAILKLTSVPQFFAALHAMRPGRVVWT